MDNGTKEWIDDNGMDNGTMEWIDVGHWYTMEWTVVQYNSILFLHMYEQ